MTSPLQVHHEIEAVVAEMGELVDGLSAEQLDWSPAADRWSISLCLSHLNTAGEAIVIKLEQRLASPGSQRSVRRFRPFERLFAWTNSPDFRVKLPSPSVYRPPVFEEHKEAIERFASIHDRLKEVLLGAARSNHLGARVSSPASPLLRLSILGWAETIIAHDRRHIAQAWRVRDHDHFPESD